MNPVGKISARVEEERRAAEAVHDEGVEAGQDDLRRDGIHRRKARPEVR